MALSSSSSVSLPVPAHHNLCAFLLKSKGSDEYNGIIDFLTRSNLHFALTTNPIIYLSHLNDFWNSAKIMEMDGTKVIVGEVAKKKITVSEDSIRAHLHLNDANGMTCFNINQIYGQLVLLGYEGENNPNKKLTFFKSMFCPHWKFLIHTLQQCISQKRSSFDQFSSNIASALICLANNLEFNFSRLIFTGMIYNLEHPNDKFLMYPRFLQIIFDNELTDLPRDGDKLVLSSHTKKIFANMKMTKGTIKGKEFSGRKTDLTAHMTGAPSNVENEPSPFSAPITQDETTPPSSEPRVIVFKRRTRDPKPTQSQAKKAKTQAVETPLSQLPQPIDLNEVVNEGSDHMERATTTVSTPLREQDSGNDNRTQSMATLDLEIPLNISNADISLDINKSSGPSTKKQGTSDDHARHGADGGSNDPLKEVNTSRGGEDSIKLEKLTKTCTKMIKLFKRQQKEILSLTNEVKRLNEEVKQLKANRSKTPSPPKRAARRSKIVQTTSSSSSSSFERDLNKYEFTGVTGMGGSSKLTETQKSAETEKAVSDPSEPAETEKEVAEVLIQVAQTPVRTTAAPSRNIGISLNEPSPTQRKESVIEASGSMAKDKGKGKYIEPEKPMKKKAQEEASLKAALKLHEELNSNQAEEDTSVRLALELEAELKAEMNSANLVEVDYDTGEKMMMTREEQIFFDEALCRGMYERQWSEMTVEERQNQLAEMLKRKRIFEAEQRMEQKRAKPPTKAQLRDIYARYIKNQTGYTLTSLKRWNFDDLKRKYEALHVFHSLNDDDFEKYKEKKAKRNQKEKGIRS